MKMYCVFLEHKKEIEICSKLFKTKERAEKELEVIKRRNSTLFSNYEEARVGVFYSDEDLDKKEKSISLKGVVNQGKIEDYAISFLRNELKEVSKLIKEESDEVGKKLLVKIKKEYETDLKELEERHDSRLKMDKEKEE